MTPTPLKMDDMTATHVGNVRSENEDTLFGSVEAGVWMVADGMGGHSNGRFASQTIADALRETPLSDTIESACDQVADAVHRANARILAKSLEIGGQVGSTFVALVVRGREFAVLWAGDSRAYLCRGDELILLTRDHTQVEAMVERGLLTREEAFDHPMKHVLARAVGVQEHLEIDAIRDAIAPGDVFLLCSDGLHSVIEDAEIARLLREKGTGACDDLIEACLRHGAPDNVTIALVAAREPTLLSLSGACF